MNHDRSIPDPPRDLTRTVLAVLLMAILIGASFWILRPFLLAIIWAAMIVVATWPLMVRLQQTLRRRAFAVAIMSGTMVIVFVVPLVLATQMLVDNADAITEWLQSLATASIPPSPIGSREFRWSVPGLRKVGVALRRVAGATLWRASRRTRPPPCNGWRAHWATSACWPCSSC